MRFWSITFAAALALGCAGQSQAVDTDVLSRKPAPEAPQGVKDMQVLMGDWQCSEFNRQQDGGWKEASYTHTWKWYYTLGGMAVQDYWFPAEEYDGEPGTNLRMYDPDSESWFIAWATTDMTAFDLLSARSEEDSLVLTGHKNATDSVPEHERRITFHNITEGHYDWKYEMRLTEAEADWREVYRLSCERH